MRWTQSDGEDRRRPTKTDEKPTTRFEFEFLSGGDSGIPAKCLSIEAWLSPASLLLRLAPISHFSRSSSVQHTDTDVSTRVTSGSSHDPTTKMATVVGTTKRTAAWLHMQQVDPATGVRPKGTRIGNLMWDADRPSAAVLATIAHGQSALQKKGYWVSCFPEGDGIPFESPMLPDGKDMSHETVLADLQAAFPGLECKIA